MGQDATKEAIIIEEVRKLPQNPGKWRTVIDEFLSLPWDENSKLSGASAKIDSKILQTLNGLLDSDGIRNNSHELLRLTEAGKRLLTSRTIYKDLKKITFTSYLRLLPHKDLQVVKQALRLVSMIVEMQTEKPDEDFECEAKKQFDKEGGYEAVFSVICRFWNTEEEEILVGALRIVLSALVTREHTTSFETTQKILDLVVSSLGRIAELVHHSSAVVRVAVLHLIRTVMLESDKRRFGMIQDAIRDSGVILWLAMYSLSPRDQSEPLGEDPRVLSREVFGLCCDENANSLHVLRRILPPPVVQWSMEKKESVAVGAIGTEKQTGPSSPATQDPQEAHVSRESMHAEVAVKSEPGFSKARSAAFNKAQKRLASMTMKHIGNEFHFRNWPLMFSRIDTTTHETPTLIWNDQVRTEIVEVLDREINDLVLMRNFAGDEPYLWPWEDFEIKCPSLLTEQSVGEYYLRLLNDALLDKSTPLSVNDRVGYMSDLSDALVTEEDPQRRLMILTTMHNLFRRYESAFVEFRHVNFMTFLIHPSKFNQVYTLRVFEILKSVCSHERNAKKFIAFGGIDSCILTICEVLRAGPAIQSEASHETSQVRVFCAQSALTLLDMMCHYSRARRSLAEGENLQRLAQVLLCSHQDLTHQTMVLINKVVESHPACHKTLYRTGIFEFLVSNLQHCTNEMSRFIRLYHRKQDSCEENNESYVSKFFPDPVITYLEEFIDGFTNSMSANTLKPNLFWNTTLRDKLIASINEHLQSFRAQLSTDPTTSLYSYSAPNRVSYPEIDAEICVGGIYVNIFNEAPGFSLPDPNAFLGDVLAATRKDQTSADYLSLLQAQIHLFEKYPTHEAYAKYSGFDILTNYFTKEIATEDDKNQLTKSAELCAVIFEKTVRSRADVFTVQLPNVESFTGTSSDMDGVKLLVDLVSRFEPTATENKEDACIVLSSLRALSAIADVPSIQRRLVGKTGLSLFRCVENLARPARLERLAFVGTYALLTLSCFARHKLLHETVLSASVLCTLVHASSFTQTSSLTEDQTLEFSRVAPTTTTAMNPIEFAVRSLRYLHAGDRDVAEILTALLTPALLNVLLNKEATEFAELVRSDTRNPYLIWNSRIASELRQILESEINSAPRSADDSENSATAAAEAEEEIENSESAPSDPANASANKGLNMALKDLVYTELKDLLYFEGIYVEVYLEQPKYAIQDPQGLFKALVLSIHQDDLEITVLAKATEDQDNEGEAQSLPARPRAQIADHAIKKTLALQHLLDNHKTECLSPESLGTISVVSSRALSDNVLSNPSGVRQARYKSIISSAQLSSPVLPYLHDLSLIFHRGLIERDLHPLVKPMFSVVKTFSGHQVACHEVSGCVLTLHKLVLAAISGQDSASLILLADEPAQQVCMALEVLGELAQRSEKSAEACRLQSIVITLLAILGSASCRKSEHKERIAAARVLGILANDRLTGQQNLTLLSSLLSPSFEPHISCAHSKPESLVDHFDETTESPMVIWNPAVRGDFVAFIQRMIQTLGEHLAQSDPEHVKPIGFNVQYLADNYDRPHLWRELKVGGIYIRCFNENPFFKVDAADSFMTNLYDMLQLHFGHYTQLLTESATSGTILRALSKSVLTSVLAAVQFVTGAKKVESFIRDPENQSGLDEYSPSELLPVVQKNILGMLEAQENLFKNYPSLQSNRETLARLPFMLELLKGYVDQSIRERVLQNLAMLATNEDVCAQIARLGLLRRLFTILYALRQHRLGMLQTMSEMVVRSDDLVWQFRASGGFVFVLNLIVSEDDQKIRCQCAELLSKLAANQKFGSAHVSYMCEFMTKKFTSKFEAKPEKFCEYFDSDHTADEISWNAETRAKLKSFLASEVSALLENSSDEWDGRQELWSPERIKDLRDPPKPIEDEQHEATDSIASPTAEDQESHVPSTEDQEN